MIKNFISPQFNKFLLVGMFNTIATYLIYLTCLLYLKYLVAYSISFACGITISYFLNTNFVFKTTASLAKAFYFLCVYLFQYVLGLVFLYVLVEFFSVNKAIAPFVCVCLTVPLTFVLNRYVLQDKYVVTEV